LVGAGRGAALGMRGTIGERGCLMVNVRGDGGKTRPALLTN